MDKKKQRIASIIIGLILAGLLVYIGVRILQERASRADVPTVFEFSRVDFDTCKFRGITATDEPLLLRYGEDTLSFFYRTEDISPSVESPGNYLHEDEIHNVGSGAIQFIVEGHEEITDTCEPYTGSAGGEDTTAGDDIPALQEDPVAQPTEPVVEIPDPEPSETVEDPIEVVPAKEALDLDTAAAYFDENEGEDFIGCFDEFKADYFGVVQVCNEAWRDATN